MKHIYLNLKRFDVPTEYGGVNRIAPVADWAEFIVKNTQEELKSTILHRWSSVCISRRSIC